MHWHTRRDDVDLYGIEDGFTLADPGALFPDAPPSVWADHPERLVDGRLRVSYGCFLIRSGEDLVMVDAGMGMVEEPPPDLVAGQMPSTLAVIGVRPEEISHVVLTHLHPDHIGGLRLPTGDAFFPEARLWVGEPELDHWMEVDSERGDAVRALMGGFVDEGRITPLDDGDTVIDGLGVLATPGHTPGHLCVEIRTESTRTVIAGDVTHHPFQAAHPDVNAVFDADPERAAVTRRRFFSEVVGDAHVAAGHYPRPGFGRVESLDGRQVFVMEDPA